MSSPSRLQATCEWRTAAWARQRDELRAYAWRTVDPLRHLLRHAASSRATRPRSRAAPLPRRRPYRPHFSRHGMREGKDQIICFR
ncbi:hypothetical protein BDA96_07G107400 [Sorghum bicolor]|uniref:Uncharacterized protein n=2 Tax=Sorghum bicolor TaxID=4558 RepID=A0A921QKG0_SORBI|nr:hypothetical protein BDA96_07G107400 [Sorghum bicolor]KXG24914.1 hypothetical protein SORBI_3007G100200 [Sorghum bicolor]